MRRRISKRAALLVAFALAAPWTAGTVGASAHPDSPQWISQAGNGQGESIPVIPNFNVRGVLFDANRFPLPTFASPPTMPRPGMTKYVAYGTIPVPFPTDLLLAQVHVTYSDDGLRWTDPVPVLIKDPAGIDVPLIINDSEDQFDVVYGTIPVIDGVTTNFQFGIYYRALDSDGNSVDDIHVAISVYGRVFEMDQSISEAGEPVVGGAAFKDFTAGPTDVIFQPSKSGAANCATVDPDQTADSNGPLTPTPWNCRTVMVYSTNDGDLEYVALAGSGNGVSFAGLSSPILSPGAAGQWDDNAATLGHLRIQSLPGNLKRFTLYYSGGELPDNACFDGQAGCWSLGTAVSVGNPALDPTLGLVYTKFASNPTTPHSLLEAFSPDDPSTLWNASVVDDGVTNHARIYFARITNAPQRDTFLAYTDEGPLGPGPTIRFSVPQNLQFRNSSFTPIEVYVTDTLGSGIVDISTLAITIDCPGTSCINVTGLDIENSLVTGVKNAAHKIKVADVLNSLSVGAHTIVVSVEDSDSNLSTQSATFTVEDAGLLTQITSSPASPRLTAIGYGLGTFVGTTTEGSGITGTPPGTAILRLHAFVTNPLGLTKEFFIPNTMITKTGPGLDINKKWQFNWVGPNLDLHFLLPGTYTVSILGEDIARNLEKPSPANTKQVTLVL